LLFGITLAPLVQRLNLSRRLTRSLPAPQSLCEPWRLIARFPRVRERPGGGADQLSFEFSKAAAPPIRPKYQFSARSYSSQGHQIYEALRTQPQKYGPIKISPLPPVSFIRA
jgi:hypothetical protein